MRIAAEMALRESEARFRSLAGLSSDLYWEQDSEFRFTAVSGTGPRVDSGRMEMVGKRRWERHYFNMTEADWAAHRADLEARRPFRDLELGRITEDGAVSWVTVSGEPMYDEAGHFVGYRGVGKDITARKREEALLALEHAVTLCPGGGEDCRGRTGGGAAHACASRWAGRSGVTSPSMRTPACCASARPGPSRCPGRRSSSSARSAPCIGAARVCPGRSGSPVNRSG